MRDGKRILCALLILLYSIILKKLKVMMTLFLL